LLLLMKRSVYIFCDNDHMAMANFLKFFRRAFAMMVMPCCTMRCMEQRLDLDCKFLKQFSTFLQHYILSLFQRNNLGHHRLLLL
jgi:hypothetical protein